MNFLSQALIYLAAAVICVPFSKRLGMGSVLGYLFAGMLIGPFVLGLIGEKGEDIMHFAEFGVFMMLFIIGLEIEPSQFWKMRKMIAGMGSVQMTGTASVIFFIMLFSGIVWQTALAVALAFAMSSTAMVLQTIKEKGLSQTSSGQAAFSVLLFQDIMIIPVLAFLPLLAFRSVSESYNINPSLIDGYPEWLQVLMFFAAVSIIFIAGKFLFVPLLRIVAKTRLRELFTASSLLLIVSVSLLMQVIGVSPALGAFLAGVVLANSEYRHELESDLEPFKGLLMGLFFIGVGASLNFTLILSKPTPIFLLVLAVMTVKFIILYANGKLFKLMPDQNILFAFALSQVGEFAFVVLAFANHLMIINRELTDIMMAVTAITMTLSPILLLINERIIDPRFGVKEQPENLEPDEIKEKNPVIIAGFGHFGSTIGRFLRANGVEATILDHNSDHVQLLRKMGFKVYYGDSTRVDLLKSAGAENASIIITSVDSPATNQKLISVIQKHFPHLHIMAKAKNRAEAYELIDMGLKNIYRENLHTAVKLGIDVLVKMGKRRYTAIRQGQKFLKYDEETIPQMAEYRHNQKLYILKTRETYKLEEELLSKDVDYYPAADDHSWDSTYIRESLNKE